MPKIKIPKKSTNIDMTAMCDVAFLLLTFFMLATKFKPSEAAEIKPPSSVSTKPVTDKDAFTVFIDKDGKTYIEISNINYKKNILKNLNSDKNLGLTEKDLDAFVKFPSLGVSLSQLPSFLKINVSELGTVQQNGIPTDSTNNELKMWIRYVLTEYAGFEKEKLNVFVKADANTEYKHFKNVIDAFKENQRLKFQLITMPEDVPKGTALYETRNKQSSKK